MVAQYMISASQAFVEHLFSVCGLLTARQMQQDEQITGHGKLGSK